MPAWKEKLERIVEMLVEGIVVFDPDGRIVFLTSSPA